MGKDQGGGGGSIEHVQPMGFGEENQVTKEVLGRFSANRKTNKGRGGEEYGSQELRKQEGGGDIRMRRKKNTETQVQTTIVRELRCEVFRGKVVAGGAG